MQLVGLFMTLLYVDNASLIYMTFLFANAGQTKTMMGSMGGASDLGAIPCAIAWLYKGINEKRQKTGSRFSVRVSALGVNATKPGSSARDLLAAHATGKIFKSQVIWLIYDGKKEFTFLNPNEISLLYDPLIKISCYVSKPFVKIACMKRDEIFFFVLHNNKIHYTCSGMKKMNLLRFVCFLFTLIVSLYKKCHSCSE